MPKAKLLKAVNFIIYHYFSNYQFILYIDFHPI